jgi:murein lipoprotein
MKKTLLLISMMVVLPVAFSGCATTGDLEKVQAEQKLINEKAEQAMQDAQAAKTAADEAKVKADATSVRAESAIKAAEERERIADEKARLADEAFHRSMRK